MLTAQVLKEENVTPGIDIHMINITVIHFIRNLNEVYL